MANRYYSSNAIKTTLASGINSTATTLQVASATGYPAQFPFTIHVDLGTSSEEIMTVTAVGGTTFTVTRGVDGSPALSHGAGATVAHGVSARDFQEPQDHITQTSGVHGTTGSLVGTTGAQTLVSKTLTSPVLTTPVIADYTSAGHTHDSVAQGGWLSPGRATVTRTGSTFNTTTGVEQVVTLTATTIAVGGTFWTAGTPTNVVLPYAGDWLLMTRVLFQSAGTNGGGRLTQLRRVSDSLNVVEATVAGPGGSQWLTVNASALFRAAAGDAFQLYVYQSSGSTLTVNDCYVYAVCVARL